MEPITIYSVVAFTYAGSTGYICLRSYLVHADAIAHAERMKEEPETYANVQIRVQHLDILNPEA